jgi:hypothetical protein
VMECWKLFRWDLPYSKRHQKKMRTGANNVVL